jgi:TRAP-type C4-dicarboxylate transport system permease small subunit
MLNKVLHYGKAIIHFLDNKIEEIIIVILCSTLVLCLTFTVIVRYAFPSLAMGSHWAEEIAKFSFIWLLYWGASLATKTGKHFSVTAQFGMLPKKFQKYAILPGYLVWFLFNLLIIYFGWELVQFSMETSLSLEIPMKYVYFIIPLSFIFISFRLVQHTYRYLKTTQTKEVPNA